MKKSILAFSLFFLVNLVFGQDKNIVKDAAAAFEESKTAFINIKGISIKKDRFKPQDAYFQDDKGKSKGYIEYPSDMNSYAFYSQDIGWADNRKAGKKRILKIIKLIKEVIPDNYVLTEDDSRNLDYRVRVGYYGVAYPDKKQEWLFILHHPDDKGLSNNKYPSISFCLNFRNGKSPQMNMIIISPKVSTLENNKQVKVEVNIRKFNRFCHNDVSIDWQNKAFNFEMSSYETCTVPYDVGIYLDYSQEMKPIKKYFLLGVKSLSKNNVYTKSEDIKEMDFLWFGFYTIEKQIEGMIAFNNILSDLEVPVKIKIHNDETIIDTYDFSKFIGKYNGFVFDQNSVSLDKNLPLELSINNKFECEIISGIASEKETVNIELKPKGINRNDNLIKYIYDIVGHENYEQMSISIIPEEEAKIVGVSVFFTFYKDSISRKVMAGNRHGINPSLDRPLTEIITDKSKQYILTGETAENHIWEDYWLRYVPELHIGQLSYRNVGNYLTIQKNGYVYTIAPNIAEKDNFYRAKFIYINGVLKLDKYQGRDVRFNEISNIFSEKEAFHKMAKIYSEFAVKEYRNAHPFTVDHEHKQSGVGILLFGNGTTYVGHYYEGLIANGFGAYYASNGTIEEGVFEDSKRNGKFKVESKTLKSSGEFVNDNRDGKWNYEDKKTGKTKVVIYKDGEIVEESEWK